MYGVFLLNSYEDIEKLLFGDEAVAPLEESCLACLQSLDFDPQHPVKLGVVATLDVLALGKWQQADQEFKVIFEHSKLKASLEYKKPCIPNKTKHANQNSDFSIYTGSSHDTVTHSVPYIVTVGYCQFQVRSQGCW